MNSPPPRPRQGPPEQLRISKNSNLATNGHEELETNKPALTEVSWTDFQNKDRVAVGVGNGN